MKLLKSLQLWWQIKKAERELKRHPEIAKQTKKAIEDNEYRENTSEIWDQFVDGLIDKKDENEWI